MNRKKKNRIRLLCIIGVLVISMTFSFASAAACVSKSGKVSSEKNRNKDDEVTIVMAGDVLMHDKVISSGLQDDGSYDFDGLFSHIKKETEAADIAIVNQETILGGKELGYSGYPSFNSPTEVGDAEAKAGFDVILQGTNHALDRSARGIENCLSFWDKTYPKIEVLGIHDSEQDKQKLCIMECEGIKIAILNYTYGTNGIQMPKGKGYLVDYLDEKKVREDIEKAEKLADITIVCPHWGNEYSLDVSDYQKKWAGIFLECGADLCIDTHPHVIEPVEVLKDDKGHEMPVYYSLGNLVNYTSGKGSGVMNRMVGGLAEIRIGRDKNGKVKILETGVRPVVCHLTKEEISVYFLEDYTEEMARQNLIRLQDPDFSLENCEKLVEKIWDANKGGLK